jgi:LysM repeat protein
MSTVAIHSGLGRTRVRSAAPARTPAAAVRLTRRGRVVLLLVMLALLLAVLTMFGSRSAATGESGTPVQTRTVEVGEGDTLWGIASKVSAPGRVRETVHEIEELNALEGPAVAVGQQIAVPVG